MDKTEELIAYLKEDIDLDFEAYVQQKDSGSDHQLYLLSSALKKYFELGLMSWRKADIRQASEYFADCVKTYNQMLVDAESFADRDGFWEDFWEGTAREEAFPAAAAFLSGADFTFASCPEGVSRFEEMGYRPWFNSKLILSCMGYARISGDELAEALDLARDNPGYARPLIALTEFHFEALTGQWADRPIAEMLEQHSFLYADLKKLKGDPDLIHGEKTHNDRVVDWLFACVLKRIGWSGRYRHAWPEGDQPAETGDAHETWVDPHSFVTLS